MCITNPDEQLVVKMVMLRDVTSDMITEIRWGIEREATVGRVVSM
jgi:hypothetical protein